MLQRPQALAEANGLRLTEAVEERQEAAFETGESRRNNYSIVTDTTSAKTAAAAEMMAQTTDIFLAVLALLASAFAIRRL